MSKTDKIKEFYDKLIIKYGNMLYGGKGDNVNVNTLDWKDFIVGILVELEHTSNYEIAMEISADHLVEDEDYYHKLIKAGLVDEAPALKVYTVLYK